MTAEVAILNTHGIALAADSAVTVNVPGKQKVYNTVNKLFTLSKYAPIGIMIYGNAELNNVPWEIIIKEFRKYYKENKRDTALEYANDFIDFIENKIFTDSDKENWFNTRAKTLADYILGKIEEDIDAELKLHAMDDDRVRITVDKAITDNIKWINKEPFLIKTRGELAAKIKAKYFKNAQQVIDDTLKSIPVSKSVRDALVETVFNWYEKDSFIPDTGFVIAGFGEKELFPRLYEYKCEGVIDGWFKRKEAGRYEVGKNGTSIVIPFAQTDAVFAFSKGIDPGLENEMMSGFEGLLSKELPTKIRELIKANIAVTEEQMQAISSNMDEIIKGCLSGIFQRIEEKKRKMFIDPLVDTAAILPLEEMASMAETFVNLSSIKKKFTSQMETVGGPIDVAVISKGDGFIWIKRKHYFEPKLNPSYFANYFKG